MSGSLPLPNGARCADALVARERSALANADIVVIVELLVPRRAHIRRILPDLEGAAGRLRCDGRASFRIRCHRARLTKDGVARYVERPNPPRTMGFLKMFARVVEALRPRPWREKDAAACAGCRSILRFIPGKAQDLRAWFLTMQYWLGLRPTRMSRHMIRHPDLALLHRTRRVARAHQRSASRRSIRIRWAVSSRSAKSGSLTDPLTKLPKGSESAGCDCRPVC